MDLTRVLEDLRKRLNQLNALILRLERLRGSPVRRGHPPKHLSDPHRPFRPGFRRVNGEPRRYRSLL
jgi:hypothetical protein